MTPPDPSAKPSGFDEATTAGAAQQWQTLVAGKDYWQKGDQWTGCREDAWSDIPSDMYGCPHLGFAKGRRPVGSAPPSPSADEMLDWLEKHRSEVQFTHGTWWVRDASGILQSGPTLRAAVIDAMKKENP